MTFGLRLISCGRPSAIFIPCLSTRTRVETFVTTRILCSIKQTVTPLFAIPRKRPMSSPVSSVIKRPVGSSSNKSLGRVANAMAMERSFCASWERFLVGSLRCSPSPAKEMISSARSRLSCSSLLRRLVLRIASYRPERIRVRYPRSKLSRTVSSPRGGLWSEKFGQFPGGRSGEEGSS